jgi:hypothetical protein
VNATGDLLGAIGAGISGLVGGSLAAIGYAVGTIVRSVQLALPRPVFPLAIAAIVIVSGWFLLRK